MKVPKAAAEAARKALRMKAEGYPGGTATGLARARKLIRWQRNGTDIPEADWRTMRAWFARHGPTARNGGTSFPGYERWRRAPSTTPKSQARGAVAWLLWGGTPMWRSFDRAGAFDY